MNVTEGKAFKAQAAGTFGPFPLGGSRYGILVHAATYGSLQFQALSPDGTTYVNIGAAVTADGYTTVDIPPGTYQFVATGGTSYNVAIVRVPF